MPMTVGPSAVGIVPVGDGTLADLDRLILNPDGEASNSAGYHLDEMSPAAAVQLRIEMNNYLLNGGGENPDVAMVADASTSAAPVSGTWIDTVTFTVVDGAITAIVLS